MPNFLASFIPIYWSAQLSSLVSASTSKCDPFAVSTYRQGNSMIVSSSDFYQEIPMKYSFFRGSWESRVAQAKDKAFIAAYLKHKEDEQKDYRASLFNAR